MSLGIAIKGPEGIVLAADSRVTLTATPKKKSDSPISVNFDNATKLLIFGEPHSYVGAVTYGQASINLRTAHSFLPEFEVSLPKDRISVEAFAEHLGKFFMDQWGSAKMPDEPAMVFLVAGYDEDAPYGRIFELKLPDTPSPKEWGTGAFGMMWGGQKEYVERIINGYDPNLLAMVQKSLKLTDKQRDDLKKALSPLGLSVPYQFLPLQDCVNLAIFLIRTTIGVQELAVTLRGVGGPIDVATITRDVGLTAIQRKDIVGEYE